jgi:hypothetical protein
MTLLTSALPDLAREMTDWVCAHALLTSADAHFTSADTDEAKGTCSREREHATSLGRTVPRHSTSIDFDLEFKQIAPNIIVFVIKST